MQIFWIALEQAAISLFWRLLAAKSRDVTERQAERSCVVLAPHPDDETLGCGGLIMRKIAAGAPVVVAVVTDGAATHIDDPAQAETRRRIAELREAETIAACGELGLPAGAVRFLRFPDGALDDHAVSLRGRLTEILDETRPAEIFCCALLDGHRDHQALARVVRDLHSGGVFGESELWEYPVWMFHFRSWRPAGRTNKTGFALGACAMLRHCWRTRVVSVSLEGIVERKIRALACHHSQLGTFDVEPEWEGLPRGFLAYFVRSREFFFPVGRRG